MPEAVLLGRLEHWRGGDGRWHDSGGNSGESASLVFRAKEGNRERVGALVVRCLEQELAARALAQEVPRAWKR